ncbi:MAG TPA: MFS transporter [Lentisphaeria bacterium]|nr:MAG: Major Facilitator Superfamily protein [Lentisphaerae bacterium ADurb.Bin082]HPY89786.1 MFS transporter [Lentisphaeria bacterium]
MIIDGPLSESRMRRSQRFYALYNFFNGLSYMCLGETIIILLAVKLNCPDYVVSTLGALVFFSFILLPTGKLLASRIGAASSQAVFWALRNTAALIVASSAIWHYYGNTSGAIATLLSGAFLFYGCRAAGVVMIQPLIGNITTDSNRASILASTAALFYVASFIALIGICFVLRYSEKLSVLTGVIVVGSLFGYTSAFLLKCIDESSSLRDSARQPLLPSWRQAIHNQTLMRQIYSSLVINLAVILTIPVSMLTIKRGYGISDRDALLFSLAQLAGSISLSKFAARIAQVLGPRKVLMGAYLAFILMAVIWVISPDSASTIFLAPLFFILGGAHVAQSNSATHYFLQSTPVKQQVNASILIYVCSGGIGGLIGLVVSGGLLQLAAKLTDLRPDICRYRLYFALVAIILIPGFWVVKRLIPLPTDKRRARITWHDFF